MPQTRRRSAGGQPRQEPQGKGPGSNKRRTPFPQALQEKTSNHTGKKGIPPPPGLAEKETDPELGMLLSDLGRLSLRGFRTRERRLSQTLREVIDTADVGRCAAMLAVLETGKHQSEAQRVIREIMSLRCYQAFQKGGEEIVFKLLPLLFLHDFRFFWRRAWIQDLFASWHRQGDEKKIQQAFFGRRGKGNRSPRLILENARRDLRIVEAVENLKQTGRTNKEAEEQVAKDIRQGKFERKRASITAAGVRAIYEKYKKGYNPFFHLVSW
jgi:hypothetical protein